MIKRHKKAGSLGEACKGEPAKWLALSDLFPDMGFAHGIPHLNPASLLSPWKSNPVILFK